MLSFPRGPCKKILLGEVTFKSKFLESFFCTQGIRAIRGGAFFLQYKATRITEGRKGGTQAELWRWCSPRDADKGDTGRAGGCLHGQHGM